MPALNLLYRGAHNLLVLEEAPSAALCDYFSQDLGLRLPEVLVMPASDDPRLAQGAETGSAQRIFAALRLHLERSASPDNQWIDGFVTDSELMEIARRLGLPATTSPEGSRRATTSS